LGSDVDYIFNLRRIAVVVCGKILASGRRMGCGVLKEGVILCSGWSFTRHSSLGDVTPCIDAVVPCKGESTLVKRKQCTTGYQHVPRCAREYM
jgi:hypothetical protein